MTFASLVAAFIAESPGNSVLQQQDSSTRSLKLTVTASNRDTSGHRQAIQHVDLTMLAQAVDADILLQSAFRVCLMKLAQH